jgi:uncharacterized protein YprB with RNaseH-like and TPR domain
MEALPWMVQYDVVANGRALADSDGTCFLIQPDLSGVVSDLDRRVQLWRDLPDRVWGRAGRRVFLDIETTGLSAAPLFLVGTLCVEGETLQLRQLLARDYSEEAAVLRQFFAWLVTYEQAITFNGQAFDVPYLLDRALYHRLDATFVCDHLDLLLPARRAWRGLLPDCRLGTLERHICGRRRIGDIAGAEIPQLYHDFVRTGEWDLLAPILFHNALDLLTMAELAGRVPFPE